MKGAGFLTVVLLVFVFGGCGSAVTSTGTSPEPTVLHVVRTVTIPSNYRAFNRTITDATAVQHLYHAALALPKAPSGVFNCPIDVGVVYHLSFQQASSMRQMDLDASGCRFLSISKTDTRQTNAAFLTLVAQVIGLPSLLTQQAVCEWSSRCWWLLSALESAGTVR